MIDIPQVRVRPFTLGVAALLALVTIGYGPDQTGEYRHADSQTGRQCTEDEYRNLNGECIHIELLTGGAR